MANYAMDSNTGTDQTPRMPVTDTAPPSLVASLNEGSAQAFVARLGGAVEHSPWVAHQAWQAHPFESLEALAQAMMAAIRTAPKSAQLALLNGHPELAGREALAGEMTDESRSEQARLGLLRLSPEQLGRLNRLNAEYRGRFGFPLIIALALHNDLDSVFAEAERRLQQPPEAEWASAIDQVCAVMRGRLQRMAGAADQSTRPLQHASSSPRKDSP